MNIRQALLKEHSKEMMKTVAGYVGNSPARFQELVFIFLQGPYRVTQRAAWPLGCCVQRHPLLIKPHLSKVINYLQVPGIHDAVKRNTIRLLQYVSVPRNLQGKVVNICFAYLSNPKEPIAVRVFSMTVLSHLAQENPELKNELIPLIEDQLPFGSAAFRSRGIKVLRELRKIKN